MAQIKLTDLLNWTEGWLLRPALLKGMSSQTKAIWLDHFLSQNAPEPDQKLSELMLSDVITDTRAIEPGCFFLALKGARFDGHDFILQALTKGAAMAATDQEHAAAVADQMNEQGWQDVPLLIVADTLTALQKIAAGYRCQLSARVVAISGSVGKTTTRELIFHSLKHNYLVHQTQGNLNNEIGLPQTLLKAKPDHDLVLLEMGMRGPGEISLLSQIAAPDIAVLTQIGWSHIERLGSQEAIFQAKAEIADGLRQSGWLVLNGDDPWLKKMAGQHCGKTRIAGFSVENQLPWPEADIWLHADQINQAANKLKAVITVYRRQSIADHRIADHQDPDIIKHSSKTNTGESISDDKARQDKSSKDSALIKSESMTVVLPLAGLHLIRNLLAALAVAAILDVPLQEAAAGAADYQPVGNRQRILKLQDMTVMDDSYNASPESMIAALETLAVMADGSHRLVAVLGDMLELGKFAAEAHALAGRRLAELGYQALFCIGQLTPEIARAAKIRRADMKISCCTHFDELTQALDEWLKPDDYVLIKGSRGLQMERISAYLQSGHQVEKQD